MKDLLPESLHFLYDEMHEFYQPFYAENINDNLPEEYRLARERIAFEMERFVEENPDTPVILQKARMHEVIAEHFVPTIFPHSPFFYEMGMRIAESWGTPNTNHTGSWVIRDRQKRQQLPEQQFLSLFNTHNHATSTPLWNGHSGFDNDHHCLGYTKILTVGINGILDEIQKRANRAHDSAQSITLEAMERSCRAVLKIALRFRKKAEEMLKTETEPDAIRYLTMIANSANIPENPPQSFYEGLLMVWFLREATASIESVGISVVGHLDRQLYHLYKYDIEHGVIDETAARDLIARWMLPTDVKCHVWDREWPETSTCLELGGCDKNGDVVWNDLTRLFIDVHSQCHLMTPKLNCRYSSDSPKEYLEFMSEKMIAGHNHFAFLNDDVLIPANVEYGKSLEDARLYVNGGCQETMCEGVEHSAGAFYYVNLLQGFSLCMKEKWSVEKDIPEEAAKIIPQPIADCNDFADFYSQFMIKIKNMIKLGAEWRRAVGSNWGEINPCPWFSTTLEGCIENALDYSDGGAKYNISGITLVGLGSLVDSLFAVKKLVFDDQLISLEKLKRILACNWQGHEKLRNKVQHLQRYGHGDAEVDKLSSDVSDQLADFIKTLPNERGEFFQPSYFVYYSFKKMGDYVAATPDGRLDGDMLAQGIAPHRVNAPESFTDVMRTISSIDFCKYPGNAVLDVQLPVGNHMPIDNVVSVMQVFAKLGGPTLQLNSASVDTMKKAQINPEHYQDLVVRISGLSACFVRLTKDVQDEIISRAVMAC